MGEVYRARDPRLRREVAIKILPPAFAADPDRLARFEREAHAVAALSHPNILAIHDFGGDNGVTYAVMELLQGQSLRGAARGMALPRRKAIDYARQIARALDTAHARGIVHRDLKPENVFVMPGEHVKVLDFGLAVNRAASDGNLMQATTQGGTQPGAVMGTPGYMSPEQVHGEVVDRRSDIFFVRVCALRDARRLPAVLRVSRPSTRCTPRCAASRKISRRSPTCLSRSHGSCIAVSRRTRGSGFSPRAIWCSRSTH
jgi:serine/threonine protein kinase